MNAIRMGFLWGALVVGLVGGVPADGWAQVRMLRAKQVSTGKWLQRVDSGAQKAVAAFKTDVAAQFGLAESDVEVVETTGTETQRQAAVTEMGTGSHAGVAVIMAPVLVVEDADGLRRGLGGIFSGSPAEKQARWGAVLEKYPAVSAVLTLLRGAMLPDAKATVTEIVTRLCRKVGAGDEVLTATEYDALRSRAVTKNLGALVPVRPCP